MSVHQIVRQSTKRTNEMNAISRPLKAQKLSSSCCPGSSIEVQQQVKPKKTLRFSDSSTLLITAPKTRSEMKSSWYSKQEISGFKLTVKENSRSLRGSERAQAMRYIGRCVQTGESQSDLDIDNKTIRGMEHLLSPEVYSVLLHGRKATIRNVLQEQARQESEGIHDDGRIAAVSMSSSKFAREWRRRITNL